MVLLMVLANDQVQGSLLQQEGDDQLTQRLRLACSVLQWQGRF
jgi:hypothetical protein